MRFHKKDFSNQKGRPNMKKILAFALAMVMVLSLCACSSSSSTSDTAATTETTTAANTTDTAAEAEAPAEAAEPAAQGGDLDRNGDGKVTIAYSTIAYAIAPLTQYLCDNLNSLAQAQGWEFNYLAAEGDASLQGQQIETLIDQDPDYLVIFPADADLAVDWVESAADADIPAFIVGTDVAEDGQEYAAAFCGPNNYEMGVELAEALIEANGADAALNIVEIGGNAGQADYIDRKAGFEDTIAAESNYAILGDTRWCASSRADAQSAMEDFLSTYGDKIDVLYGMDDDLTLGGVAAITAAGKTDDIQVYSITGQVEAIQAIKDGKMVTTAYTPTLQTASLVIAAISEYAANGTIEYQQSYVPDLINASNVDGYEGEF
jgi:ABC-type sugar transport system substrate-binding protein